MNNGLNIKNKMMIAEQKEEYKARRGRSLVLFGLRAIEAPEAPAGKDRRRAEKPGYPVLLVQAGATVV